LSGTAVGVVQLGDQLPSYTLPRRGGLCQIGTDKIALNMSDQTYYDGLKAALMSTHEYTSSACQAYFGADSARMPYFSSLPDAVSGQLAFDGPSSTLSRWDAGVMSAAALATQAAVNYEKIMKQIPICSIFVPDPGLGASRSYTTSTAQAVSSSLGSNPAHDVYMNTDQSVLLSLFTGASIVHEALHNVTGRDDQELASLLGVVLLNESSTREITDKLAQAGCAP
jgi:hypothetical protein